MPVNSRVTCELSGDDLARINRLVLVTSSVRGTVHTVNNILQTIGGQAEMLSQRDDLPDDARRRVDRIAAQTDRAADFMRELSSLGRETRDATDRTDLRLVADRVCALRQYDLSRAQIAVDVSGDPGGVCTGAIDEQALMLVLSNLLLNAEQALIGQPDARIAISIHKQDGRVLVRVQDNGPGVSPEHQDRIFEPFYTTGRPGATLGLGLPVARMVVAEHGGQLRLASCADTGGGACFEIDLPAAG